ncbi:MAG: hypothetical protein PWQ28_329 [Candidatus Woesearchaeota archaeon]|nr:hypothetical protein [Candidatus Woesearchaeota archaeon]
MTLNILTLKMKMKRNIIKSEKILLIERDHNA